MTQRAEDDEPVRLERPLDASALLSALALSAVTGRACSLVLSAPLAQEDVASVHALGQLFAAEIQGAQTGSSSVRCTPGEPRAGDYAFSLPSGTSVVPLFEAMLLPLSLCRGTSRLKLSGATHLAGASSFHDLALSILPCLERQGLAAEVALDAAGFGDEGPGLVRARVFPTPRLSPVTLLHRGMLQEVRTIALLANVGRGLAQPMERRAAERLRARGIVTLSEALPMPADKVRGVAVVVASQFEHVRLTSTAVGEPGREPAQVADEAVESLLHLLERRGAADGALGTRLLLTAALAASTLGAPGALHQAPRQPSRFTVSEVTGQMLQLADVARALLRVRIRIQGLPGDDGLVEVSPEDG